MSEPEWDEFLQTNFAIGKEELALELIKVLKAKENYIISDIIKKENKKNPYPPFITSALQVEASRKLRFRPRRTMMIAQQLYEGIDLGDEGTTGLITYMRTDSTRLNADIINDARDFILNNHGNNYLPEKPRLYDQKNKKMYKMHMKQSDQLH